MTDFAQLAIDHLTGPNLQVFDGAAPAGMNEPENYVVVSITTPRPETERLSADHSMRTYLLTTMSVGTSAWQVRETAELVHSLLTRHRLIASATPLRLGTAAQVREDNSINPPAWIATDVWRFSAPKEAA